MKVDKLLKNYDKFLKIKKRPDGGITILRQSPFDSDQDYIILAIANQYIGSGNWIIRKLISMDTHRHDHVGRVLKNNAALKNRKRDRSMSEDIATFVLNGGSTFIR